MVGMYFSSTHTQGGIPGCYSLVPTHREAYPGVIPVSDTQGGWEAYPGGILRY